jgi:hypothetical protein
VDHERGNCQSTAVPATQIHPGFGKPMKITTISARRIVVSLATTIFAMFGGFAIGIKLFDTAEYQAVVGFVGLAASYYAIDMAWEDGFAKGRLTRLD